jgi:hypothetical protein
MAIRNDFAPGEVLAAADLNDTFGSKVNYPSGGATGNVLIKDGTSAIWGQGAGLTRITNATFSGVSDVSVDGCFTSDFVNYLLIFRYVSTSGTSGGLLRLRASGSDDTGANYDRSLLTINDSTVTGARQTAQSSYSLGAADTSRNAFAMLHLQGPQLASTTNFLSHDVDGRNTIQSAFRAGYHTVTSAYDGFTLFTTGAGITGQIRVYGYRN